ncbi:MAG: hypothetical protein HY675_05560 [Chloroflexi bacterium]|nr:hypothetical protein [Chloroflexota bacterium]
MNPPTGLSATGGGYITLNWTATLDTYATGHRLLRGSSTGGPYSQIAEVTPRTTVTYNDNPTAGSYYYVARAFYANWESLNTSEVSATVTIPGVAFGAASSANTGDVALASLGFNHTTSGSNRLLIVGISIRNDSAQNVRDVTYAGINLNRVGAVNFGTNERVELWKLVAPAIGQNAVAITLSAPARFVAGAASFSGVNQTTPLGTFFSANGNGPTASVTVTGVNQGELVIDTMGNRYLDTTATLPCPVQSQQTQRWAGRTTSATADSNTPSLGSTSPGPVGGGSVVVSWNIEPGAGCSVGTISRAWAQGAVAIKPQ